MERIIFVLKDFYFSISELPPVLQLAMVLSFVFICVYIITFLNLIYLNWEKKSVAIQKKTLNLIYLQKIKEIVYSPKEYTLEDIKLVFENKKDFKKTHKLLITETIIELIAEDEVYDLHNFNEILYFFDLKSFWEERLLKGNLKTKLEGLAQIIKLRLTISESVIISLVYDKNEALRKKARKAYIYLSKHDPFRFFNEDFDSEFTEWDKIQIHEILLKRAKEFIPNFAQWITRTENIDLKCFFIYETSFYKQQENLPFLLTLLTQTTNSKVRKALIEAIGVLQNNNIEDALIANYDFEPISVQHSIIKTVTETKPDNGLEFLRSAFYKTFDTSLKIRIGRAIYNYDNEGVNLINEMESKIDDGFENLIFKHIKNPLIKV
ncbi:hypothetical protein [Flavobacterium columnare]|uniref:hypothetical protein n=1 Tax=Flavobacterium columnare TaxID=996 RepID=UPI003BA0B662